jgi:flagellin-like hook-associated protein FlgL
MSINAVSLSSSTRANLASLRQTADLLSSSEEKLATGKKVNSALDNATEYFASRGFLNKANDLSNLKDSLSTSIQTVTSAISTIDSVQSLVEQLQSITVSALQTSDTTTRSGYATQYNSLMKQIDYLVSDATFNGTNLLNNTANLLVYFNESNTTTLTVSGVNATAAGLGISVAGNRFATVYDIQVASSLLQTAMASLRTDATQFGNTTTVITTRQTFTDSMIDTLQTASDNLILADTNQESANLTALQTRNSLAVISLGISNQAQQAILRLF